MQYSPRRTSLTRRQALKLAALLKARRRERGLSMNQLADISGLNDATVFRLERGDILTPQPDTLRALGESLGVSTYELFLACEWISSADLPSLGAYLRTKYGELSEADIAELQDQLHELSRGDRPSSPKPHEDER